MCSCVQCTVVYGSRFPYGGIVVRVRCPSRILWCAVVYCVLLCTVHISPMGVLLYTVSKYNPLLLYYGGIVVYGVQVESFRVQLCTVYCCVRFTFPLLGYC